MSFLRILEIFLVDTMRSHPIHIHQRKYQKLEKFPHPWVNFLDRFLLIVAVVAPAMTIPQIYKVFSQQNAAGISILTWSMYALLCVPWLVYGFVHKEKPIIVSYAIWLITDVTVVIGALMYG